jgi:hypothetical protein
MRKTHLFVLILQERLIADFNVQREKLWSIIFIVVQKRNSGCWEQTILV